MPPIKLFSLPKAGYRCAGFRPPSSRLHLCQAYERPARRLRGRGAAGEGPPPHLHDREEEFFRVLEARVAFCCSGQRVEHGAGAVIVVLRGAVHRFQTIGDTTGRLMIVMTPGGFEGFFPAVDAEAPQSHQQIDALAARFGMRFLPALAALTPA
ncbi:cupin domain-containing protein [Citreimonas sp.]|uniref:cupin domain-containing protein n=1 Tax=Citreimonas sp. TaxID=3036715 RepID=UPI004058D486